MLYITYIRVSSEKVLGELTYAQAAAVTSIGSAFNKCTAVSFNEFIYFTGVTNLKGVFNTANCKIDTITFPPSITTWGTGYNAAFYLSNIKNFIISEGTRTITSSWHVLYHANGRRYISFPSTFESSIPNVSSSNFSATLKLVINGNSVKPIVEQSYYKASMNIYAYVPDELVDDYRADSSWSSHFNVNKILPISELTV